jgi:hypothetical protein
MAFTTAEIRMNVVPFDTWGAKRLCEKRRTVPKAALKKINATAKLLNNGAPVGTKLRTLMSLTYYIIFYRREMFSSDPGLAWCRQAEATALLRTPPTIIIWAAMSASCGGLN